MYKDDNSIMLRVFDYGYSHSKRNSEDIFDEKDKELDESRALISALQKELEAQKKA